MTAKDLDEGKRKEIVYGAVVQCYLENALFGMIRIIDNSLTELLRFSLTILAADVFIMAITEYTGPISVIITVLFLSSHCAFLLSSMILLTALIKRAPLEVDLSVEVSALLQNCKESLENLYKSKHKMQKFSMGILFIGIVLLLTSIISVIYTLRISVG